MKPQKEKLHLEGLKRIIETVAKKDQSNKLDENQIYFQLLPFQHDVVQHSQERKSPCVFIQI